MEDCISLHKTKGRYNCGKYTKPVEFDLINPYLILFLPKLCIRIQYTMQQKTAGITTADIEYCFEMQCHIIQSHTTTQFSNPALT